MDSNVNLVGLSSKLQQSLSGLLRNMPILPKPSNFFDSLQSKPEIIKRRVKSGRNPNTGLLHNAQSMSPIRPSTTATKLSGGLGLDMSKTMDYTKLNTRVIEGWINSTLTDAEYLDIPGCIMKPETKLPLVRFGVDRASLIVKNI